MARGTTSSSIINISVDSNVCNVYIATSFNQNLSNWCVSLITRRQPEEHGDTG
jgi:hypothetical protein